MRAPVGADKLRRCNSQNSGSLTDCFTMQREVLLGTPKTGPNRVYALETQQSYGKRVTWVHSAQPASRSFWVAYHKCMSHFGSLGPKKRAKRPVSGHQREKPNQRLRRHQNFGDFTRWNFSDWFINGPATTRFSAKTRFHPPTSSYSWGWWYEVSM